MSGTEITTRTLPACTVASARQTLPSATHEGELWQRLWLGLGLAGGTPAANPLVVAVYHDDLLLTRDADLEVLLEVAAPFAGTEQVRCRQLPATLVASRRLDATDQDVPGVFDALGRWIARNGYRFAGPMFSIYRPDSGGAPHTGRLVSEVCAPVAVLDL